MSTVINISNVRDYSSEPVDITYSNPVTTVINRPDPPPIVRRYIRAAVTQCRPCRCCGICRLLCLCQNCRRHIDVDCESHECAFKRLNS